LPLNEDFEQTDGYIRISPRRRAPIRESEAATNPNSLLFVDLDYSDPDPERVIDAFQQLPQRLVSVGYVVFRWPHIRVEKKSQQQANDKLVRDWLNTVTERLEHMGLRRLHVGVVRFRVGDEPRLVWASNSAGDHRPVTDALLLQRALRAELSTLLDWGHAVWRPLNYHYKLPSGYHSGSFVRVADIFRSPRDARVMTSWLTPRMVDGLGLVAESSTLNPLLTDIHAVMAQAELQPGPVEVLDEYPRTQLDVDRAVRSLAVSIGGVLGLLSVNGSGRYRDMIYAALQSIATPARPWSMIVLVDNWRGTVDGSFVGRVRAEAEGADRISTWHSVSSTATNPLTDECSLCKSFARAPLVTVDPRSYEVLALPSPELVTPDTFDAGSNVDFWQSCFESEALGHSTISLSATAGRSKDRKLTIRVDWAKLTPNEAFVRRVVERLRAASNLDRLRATDEILVDHEDVQKPGFEDLYNAVADELGLSGLPWIIFNPEGEQDGRVGNARNLLIFELGSISGFKMRDKLLVRQSLASSHRGASTSGLIVRARPATSREWENLYRSFSNQLVALWRTYLPLRSPFDEEAVHLQQLDPSETPIDPAAQQFLTQRINLCQPREFEWERRLASEASGNSSDPRAIFWGSELPNAQQHVRGSSLYGREVDALTAFSAVGAAVHAKRVKGRRDNPRRRLFEMPAISRSYYDALILASILRWLEPHECWWGDSPREAINAVEELLARTTNSGDRRILVPELLLGASQGKLSGEAARALLDGVSAELETMPEDHRAPTELGMILVERSFGLTRRGGPVESA
jgi:hypothetical protein